MLTRNKTIPAVFGVASLLLVGGLSPARADRFDAIQRAVHRDLDNIHRDEVRVQNLTIKRDAQRDHGDWRGVRNSDRQLRRANLDLRHDQDVLGADQRALDALAARRHW
jgi:hypothetical protein